MISRHRPIQVRFRECRSVAFCVTARTMSAADYEQENLRVERTFRFSGAIGPSRPVAGRRLISQLPAPIVAVGRPASATASLRWLPIWLPAVGDPAVIGLHISGFADRSLNSRTRAAAVSCAGPSRPPAAGVHHVQQRRLQLTHNLPSCLAHAGVPLMINRQEARGGTCCTRSGQTVGQGRIDRAVPHRTQGTDEDRARNIRRYVRFSIVGALP
jgi:hypothetical protein